MTGEPNAWEGDGRDPDSTVTITLRYRTAKRVLAALKEHGMMSARRGRVQGLNLVAEASDAIGDAMDAPVHRRFRMPERYVHGVIAGSAEEFLRWVDSTRTSSAYDPVFVDSIETAQANAFASWEPYGTGYRRDDFQEVVAAVRSRTFPESAAERDR